MNGNIDSDTITCPKCLRPGLRYMEVGWSDGAVEKWPEKHYCVKNN